jgi:hypothetical protein
MYVQKVFVLKKEEQPAAIVALVRTGVQNDIIRIRENLKHAMDYGFSCL